MMLAIAVDQQRAESCLGASESAGVLGLDPYKPPISVWRRLRGMEVHDDDAGEAAYWGHVIEPIVRAKYSIDRKVWVYVPLDSVVRDGWLRATPDGLVHDGDGENSGVVECTSDRALAASGLLQVKTCASWLEHEWDGGPPAKYEVQCRVEMAVCDLPWCDIVCLCGGQRQLGPFRIERDAAIEARIVASLREFFDMAQAGVEPSPDHTDAWRMHVGERMQRARPVAMQPDDDMRENVADWRRWRDMRDNAKREESRSRNEILLRMSVAGATRVELSETERITAYKTKGVWALRAPMSWRGDE